MEDKTTEILQNWGLQTLVKRFQDNFIDEGILAVLTMTHINELIPEIGLRIKFVEKWKEYFGREVNSASNKTETVASISDTSSVSSEDSDVENKDPVRLERQNCFVGKRMYKKLTQPKVKTILQQSHSGRTILKNYAKTKTLTKQSRNSLVDIIITYMLDNVHGQVNKDDFYILAKDIIEIFPTEDINLYYVAPISKSDSKSKKSISIRGKLPDKYRNKARLCKKLSTDSGSVQSTESSSDTVVSNEIEESISWLTENQAPWEMVESHWRITRDVRIKEWRSSECKRIIDIIEKWSVLQHPMGFKLIEEDFAFLKLTKEVISVDEWNSFFERILSVCPIHTKKNKRTETLYELLQVEIPDESKVAVQLCLLAYMIPPRGRIRAKKQHFKPSMSECEESIIVHVKNLGDVSRIREERITAMQRLGLTVQPYIIVVGSTLADITTTFVSVDAILYNVPSVLKAIDVCFKTFHTFDACYPPQSEHIWYLIQHELYKFTTRYDRQISYVLEIISALRNKTTT